MIARKIFIAGMIAIPFSGVAGIKGLGETQHELSTYFFFAAMWLALLGTLPAFDSTGGSHRFKLPRAFLLPEIFFVAIAIIAFSFLFNVVTISTDHFRGRYGLTKFIFSLLILGYGFGLAYMTYFMARYRWQNVILLPIAISVLICAAYSFFEVLSWYGVMKGPFEAMYKFTHGGFDSLFVKWNGTIKRNIDWETRLRSLAFEPPAFGNYAGYAWPWVLAGVAACRGAARGFYALCFALLNLLMLLADARTGYLMLAGSLAVWAALRYAYLPKNPRPDFKSIAPMATLVISGALLTIVVSIFLSFDTMVYNVIVGDSVSNISRLASQTAAFNMFAANPLFGVGFGQFGFHIAEFLPYWGYYSWELQPWLIFPEAPWPAVYSIYARLAAETGFIGLFSWIFLWVWLARRITIVSKVCQRLTGVLPPMAYPLIMSCYCSLTTSFAYDSFRTPMIWITLGLAARYLEECRQLLGNYRQAAIESVAQNNALSAMPAPQEA